MRNAVGDLSIFGVPVTLDDNIPINLGSGTNEDRILAIRPDDHQIYESPVYVLVAPQGAGAASKSVTISVYSYLAFTAAR